MRRARRLPLEELASYLLEVPKTRAPLNWTVVFDNDHPVQVEVGFGKGLFLVTSAQAQPEVNYLGIEISRKYQLFTATRLAKRRLANVRLTKADAREFLRDHVASESCQAIHIYFPDPWWKKRHLKRRVFTAEFVEQCQRILQPEGQVHVATDVEEYFKVMLDLLSQHTRLQPLRSDETGSVNDENDYLSNFERKFRQAGRSIFRAIYVKAGRFE